MPSHFPLGFGDSPTGFYFAEPENQSSTMAIKGKTCNILCECSDFSLSNWEFKIMTWLSNSDRELLRNNVVPKAYLEIGPILGLSMYMDATFDDDNSLWICPVEKNNTLHLMRASVNLLVNEYTENRVDNETWEVKLTGFDKYRGDPTLYPSSQGDKQPRYNLYPGNRLGRSMYAYGKSNIVNPQW